MDYKLIEQQLDELNLDGYKHIKNNNWELPEELISWLEDHNFKKIGDGVFSSVFQSETEKFVVKINKGELMDVNYIDFIDFCSKNQGNLFLPKTGKIKKYKKWYILFIEQLNEINNPCIKEFLEDDSLKEIIKIIPDMPEKKLLEYITDKTYHYSINKKYNQQIFNIVTIINNFLDNYGISTRKLDLHEGNIMMRGDTLVITDPVI